jgi:hypothetical protein
MRFTPRTIVRRVSAAVTVAAAAVLAACGPSQPNTDTRLWSENYALRVSTDPLPPHARERTVYKVVARDRESGQPIEGGEGVIYATNADQHSIWDSLERGPEVGTYYARMNFITAGDWAVAIEFRSDSTKRLEKMEWRQDVRAARGEPVS